MFSAPKCIWNMTVLLLLLLLLLLFADSTKIKRSISILSIYYLNLDILINLYYSLNYPFIIVYSLVCSYHANINPHLILQKLALRILTLSKFDVHSSPLFKQTNILKLFDLIKFQISIFMYKLYNILLPSAFDNYFLPSKKVQGSLLGTHVYAIPN